LADSREAKLKGDSRMKRFFYLVGVVFLFSTLGWAGSIDPKVETILDHYFKIQASLAKDTTAGVDAAAGQIARLASETRSEDAQIKKFLTEVQTAAQQIKGKDLESTRLQFFELSKPLFSYLHQHYKGQKSYFRYFCSMAKKGWVQPDKGVRNPYYGSSMLTCGTLVTD
jgi:hypothetical protein